MLPILFCRPKFNHSKPPLDSPSQLTLLFSTDRLVRDLFLRTQPPVLSSLHHDALLPYLSSSLGPSRCLRAPNPSYRIQHLCGRHSRNRLRAPACVLGLQPPSRRSSCDVRSIWHANTYLHIIIDCMIYLLPISFILRVLFPTKQKVLLFVFFAFGFG